MSNAALARRHSRQQCYHPIFHPVVGLLDTEPSTHWQCHLCQHTTVPDELSMRRDIGNSPLSNPHFLVNTSRPAELSVDMHKEMQKLVQASMGHAHGKELRLPSCYSQVPTMASSGKKQQQQQQQTRAGPTSGRPPEGPIHQTGEATTGCRKGPP